MPEQEVTVIIILVSPSNTAYQCFSALAVSANKNLEIMVLFTL